MVPITERPRPGRRARERQLEKRGKAPLCRVGRSDEPAPSRWNRCTSDASGFLLQRHAHHTASRFSYGETLAQASLRTITRKAGNSNSVKDFTAFWWERVNVRYSSHIEHERSSRDCGSQRAAVCDRESASPSARSSTRSSSA